MKEIKKDLEYLIMKVVMKSIQKKQYQDNLVNNRSRVLYLKKSVMIQENKYFFQTLKVLRV